MNEKLLQDIWSHQRLRRDTLHLSDGRGLKVLHPGFWNHESGPDFSGAVLQFDRDAHLVGDIEIDLVPGGWVAHGHHVNADFQNVVLQVVWEASAKISHSLPVLALKDQLDAPVRELIETTGQASPFSLPRLQQGRCCAPLEGMDARDLHLLLESAAGVRLNARSGRIRARAREVGWDQALTEALFRVLGYKHNAWALQRLGELTLPVRAGLHQPDVLRWQALLFGLSGLLPRQIRAPDRESGAYVKRLWDIWWRERDRFDESILPQALWRLNGLRPANHPHRRLALAAHWMCKPGMVQRLEQWFADIPDEAPRHGSILSDLAGLLIPTEDPFWSRHWTLNSGRTAEPHSLLGTARLTDLAMNALLPWFHTRSVLGGNRPWKSKAERLWLTWPKAQDNAVLRLARGRLLGNASPTHLRTAAHQQGLIQIVRDFCDHSNAVCDSCVFPELVANWESQHA